jgi:hypothetical protein
MFPLDLRSDPPTRDEAEKGSAGDSPITGRFLSVDPALESAHPGAPQTWNRYAYVAGNPINSIDPSGEVLFFIGPLNALRQVEQVANDTLHGYDLVIGGNGQARLMPNSEVGAPSSEQRALQSTLASAIDRRETVSINVTSGDSAVTFGQYISGRLDIGDIAAVGKGAGVTDASILAHEVREQEIKQIRGLPNTPAGHAQAHARAVDAQEAVSGYQKVTTTPNLSAQNTGTITGVHRRGTVVITVTFQFVRGRLTRVSRR